MTDTSVHPGPTPETPEKKQKRPFSKTLGRLAGELRGLEVEERTARGIWLKDLCVHEGYHENLLRLVDRAIAGASDSIRLMSAMRSAKPDASAMPLA